MDAIPLEVWSAFVAVAAGGLLIVAVADVNAAHEAGRKVGYETGHAEGYGTGREAGHAAGHAEGYEAGRKVGHEAGHAEGYEGGREIGHEAGYAEGYRAGRDAGTRPAMLRGMRPVENWDMRRLGRSARLSAETVSRPI